MSTPIGNHEISPQPEISPDTKTTGKSREEISSLIKQRFPQLQGSVSLVDGALKFEIPSDNRRLTFVDKGELRNILKSGVMPDKTTQLQVVKEELKKVDQPKGQDSDAISKLIKERFPQLKGGVKMDGPLLKFDDPSDIGKLSNSERRELRRMFGQVPNVPEPIIDTKRLTVEEMLQEAIKNDVSPKLTPKQILGNGAAYLKDFARKAFYTGLLLVAGEFAQKYVDRSFFR